MAMFGIKDATPTDPAKQFSGRYRAGLGTAYGPQRASGAPELFANTPLEQSNRREFASLKHDFLVAHDVDSTNIYKLNGVGCTLTIVADSPNGLAVLTAADDTLNTTAQMQFYPGNTNVTAAGEIADPVNQEVFCCAWCGKMPYALTSSWFIGVAENDTAILAAGGAMGNACYIGFHHVVDTGLVYMVAGDNATKIIVTNPLRTLWTPADSVDTLRELAVMVVENRKFYWFVDGICVGSTQVGDTETGGTTAAFTDKMSPSISTRNKADVQTVTYVDYMMFSATRLTAPVGG